MEDWLLICASFHLAHGFIWHHHRHQHHHHHHHDHDHHGLACLSSPAGPQQSAAASYLEQSQPLLPISLSLEKSRFNLIEQYQASLLSLSLENLEI